MHRIGTLPIILYNNAQKAKDLACDTELEMEGLAQVAEGNDIEEVNDEGGEVVGGNEADNNECVGNVQGEEDVKYSPM